MSLLVRALPGLVQAKVPKLASLTQVVGVRVWVSAWAAPERSRPHASALDALMRKPAFIPAPSLPLRESTDSWLLRCQELLEALGELRLAGMRVQRGLHLLAERVEALARRGVSLEHEGEARVFGVHRLQR